MHGAERADKPKPQKPAAVCPSGKSFACLAAIQQRENVGTAHLLVPSHFPQATVWASQPSQVALYCKEQSFGRPCLSQRNCLHSNPYCDCVLSSSASPENNCCGTVWWWKHVGGSHAFNPFTISVEYVQLGLRSSPTEEESQSIVFNRYLCQRQPDLPGLKEQPRRLPQQLQCFRMVQEEAPRLLQQRCCCFVAPQRVWSLYLCASDWLVIDFRLAPYNFRFKLFPSVLSFPSSVSTHLSSILIPPLFECKSSVSSLQSSVSSFSASSHPCQIFLFRSKPFLSSLPFRESKDSMDIGLSGGLLAYRFIG